MKTRPRAHGRLADLYRRVIHDETGETVQYLAPQPDGTLHGWEVYEDGSRSDTFEVGRVLPIGYYPVEGHD